MLLKVPLLSTLVGACAVPINLKGCQQPLPSGQSAGKVSNITITSSGQDRSFLLFVPPNYRPDTQTSVILSYHGGNRDAESQLELDELTEPQFNSDSFVIYPQGINV